MKHLWKSILAAVALCLQVVPSQAQDAPMAAAPAVSCCESCDSRCGGLLVDIGFYVLTPYWSHNNAFVIQQTGTTPQTLVHQQFGYVNQFAPRVSLGFANSDGLGVRTTWWGFSVSNTESLVVPDDSFATAASPLGIQDMDFANFPVEANEGETLVASSKLSMNVWDIEAIYDAQLRRCDLLISGGLRYAHIAQRYDASVIEGDTVTQRLLSGHNFNGAGPTVAVEARRGVGNGGLYLLGSTRGSLLFGRAKQEAYVAYPDDLEAQAFFSNHVIRPVGEVELGAGWQSQGRRLNFFMEVSFVGQIWWNAGNASRTSGYSDDGGYSSTSATDDDLGLLGARVGTGVRY